MTDTVRDNVEKEVQNEIVAKSKRSRLEKWLDKYNHIMELMRTVIAIAAIILQMIILYFVLH